MAMRCLEIATGGPQGPAGRWQRLAEVEGFEPPRVLGRALREATPFPLPEPRSGAFSHSATPPNGRVDPKGSALLFRGSPRIICGIEYIRFDFSG